MNRAIAALFVSGLIAVTVAAPANAQTGREVGEMRLYIQQLEAQVRDLTGENEQLRFELRNTRARAALPSGSGESAGVRGTLNPQSNSSTDQGAPQQDLGTLAVGQDGSVAQDDPLIAPDGGSSDLLTVEEMQGDQQADPNAPLDLSALAGGQQDFQSALPDSLKGRNLDAGNRSSPSEGNRLTASITGGARDEYDLAYGYILTGDYPLAEAHFRAWIGAFPSEPLADDARFWLAESQLRQGDHQAAATAFLELHKRVPNNPKGPDTLVKLGVALAGLGEKEAACATFSEVAKKYPDATGATMARVQGEQQRARC